MNAITSRAEQPAVPTSGRVFLLHFVEMVVAMLVGMAVLGTAASLIFAALGHAKLLHYSGLRGFLMTMYMVVGMSLWMRYRHHAWERIVEMDVAMGLPYVILIAPFAIGAISASTFLVSMHALMLPCMIVAMLLRFAGYGQNHRHGVRHHVM